MAMRGHRVYVTYVTDPWSFQRRLLVLNVSDPAQPVEEMDVPADLGLDTVVADSIVVAAEGNRGFRVWNIFAPTGPAELGHYLTPGGMARDVCVRGSTVFVADDIYFGIYDISRALPVGRRLADMPRQFDLHPAFPNPFNPSTTISYSLPRASKVKLNIFDITGRLVQTLTDKRLEAGEHRMSFDGTALASGVYFARIEAGEFTRTQKLMLVK
jgi:hypothetical protein